MLKFTVTVRTPDWAGSEVFSFDVAATGRQGAEEAAMLLVCRDFPQGASVVSVISR